MRIASRVSVPMVLRPVVNFILMWSPSIVIPWMLPTSMPAMRTVLFLFSPPVSVNCA